VNNGGCHSFCSRVKPIDAKTAQAILPLCQPPFLNHQSEIDDRKSPGYNNATPPLPQKGEKKQKKRTKLKTANGVR
jgi:hypothetical protein